MAENKFTATEWQSTDTVANPFQFAQYASIVLSADKGIPNEIQPIENGGFNVVTDEGKYFRFIRA